MARKQKEPEYVVVWTEKGIEPRYRMYLRYGDQWTGDFRNARRQSYGAAQQDKVRAVEQHPGEDIDVEDAPTIEPFD